MRIDRILDFACGFVLNSCIASFVLVLLVLSGRVSFPDYQERVVRPVPFVDSTYTVPTDIPEPVADPEFVQKAMLPYSEQDFKWMQLNIYFEARNKSYKDMLGVGLVVINRVNDPRYPNSVYDVLTQAKIRNGLPIRNQCAFSWYCDGNPDKPNLSIYEERKAWEASGRAAHQVLAGEVSDFTNGALYYHAPYVRPRWTLAKRNGKPYVTQTAKVGHIFYARN